MPETAELSGLPQPELEKVERQHPSSYAEYALQQLKDTHVWRSLEINRKNPEYHRARKALQESMDRATPDQKAKIEGINLLGEQTWIDIQAQIRIPETRQLLMRSVEIAMQEASDKLKEKDVIEVDWFQVGSGVHSAVAASIFRREHPGMGILSIGEGTVFGVSEHDSWVLNTASLTPFNEEYESAGFKANRDMNHLPGLPIQPRELDARLNPGNRSVSDAVTLSNFLSQQGLYETSLEGSLKRSTNPNFRYEHDVRDNKTGRIITIRFNGSDIGAGFGRTDYEKVGDRGTQVLIAEEIAKQDQFMFYLRTGKIPEGKTDVPEPAQIILGIEHGYPMFGYDSRDPLHFFRNKDVLVIGAGGHTGLTMLMNLAHVNSPQPGFDLDPHGNGKIYAAGLKTPTREAYLEADDLPIYKPLAETLPVEQGGDGFIMPIGAHISSLRRAEDGKIKFEYKDPETGEMKSGLVDSVIITAGMKSSVDLATEFAEIPGFNEGSKKFTRIEDGNITQQLEGEEVYLLGATAAFVQPRKVSPREHELMPGFKEGAASPVMVRTVHDTYKAVGKIAQSISALGLKGPIDLAESSSHIHIGGDWARFSSPLEQLDNALYVPRTSNNSPSSIAGITFNVGEILDNVIFPPDMTELSIVLKPPEPGKGLEICPNIPCDNPDVARVIEKLCSDPSIQYLALTTIESAGKAACIKIPIENNHALAAGFSVATYISAN